MKDIVSFETAKQLKEAGFPQPMPEAGQFWYQEFSEAVHICANMRMKGNIKCFDMTAITWFDPHPLDGLIYAPTVAELLSASGGSLSQYVTGEWLWRGDAGGHELGRNLPELLANIWLRNSDPKQ